MINFICDLRPWVKKEAGLFFQKHTVSYQTKSFNELESKAFILIETHEQLIDKQNNLLYEAINVLNPIAKNILSSSKGIGARIKYPGAK